MKKIAALLVLFSFLSIISVAQARTTIILLRHAEKEAGGIDPSLSPAGLERSYKLQKALKDYHPDLFYSTDYKRTRESILPWANAVDKQIELYDPSDLAAFAAKLKALAGKTVVVVGHSNTTPQLANLLLGQEKYATLDDAVFNKIWIVTLEGQTANDKIIEY